VVCAIDIISAKIGLFIGILGQGDVKEEWNEVGTNGWELEQIITAGTPGKEFVGDFGAAGVWQFDGTNWIQLTGGNPNNDGHAMTDLYLLSN